MSGFEVAGCFDHFFEEVVEITKILSSRGSRSLFNVSTRFSQCQK